MNEVTNEVMNPAPGHVRGLSTGQVGMDTVATPRDLQPEDIAANDAGYWTMYDPAVKKFSLKGHLRLQNGLFTLEGHEYQLEPLRSTARRRCYMKATGGGFSEIEILKALHGLIHRKYPLGVLYLFPTTDDVQEFSKARFGPLIAANPRTIGRFVKPGGKGADTASLKRVNDGFLYLRGARLSQMVEGGGDEKESTKLRAIQVDALKCDESELMAPEAIAKALGRLGASLIKEEVYISNPGIPDDGIDRIFQTSDQRHLFHKCEACGGWTCAVLGFPDSVKLRQDGTGYIACKKCGREIHHRTEGEWVPAVRENSGYMVGYQWSHLNSLTNDPGEVLRDYENPPHGNRSDIIRLRLGLPDVAAEDRLSPGMVRECCGPELMPMSHAGPCAMGVDVGQIKHVVIGIRTGPERFEILKVIRLSTWPEIHDMARRFNVKSAIIDARPYEDEARGFQKAEPYRIFLANTPENTLLGANYNDATGIVTINKTELFDATHRVIITKALTLPRPGGEVDHFMAQCCNCAKVLETNKRTGTAIYRYRTVGTASVGDHYRCALNYFYLAASGSRIATVSRFKEPKQLVVVNDYDPLSF